MKTIISLLALLMAALIPAGQAGAQYCEYTNAPDIDGEYKCGKCAYNPVGYPKYEPFLFINCFYGCLRCQVIAPRPGEDSSYCDEGRRDSFAIEDPANSVLLRLTDALEGADWDALVNKSPAHAMFFVGAKAKGDAGERVDVRDWHIAIPFIPTEAVVRMFQDGSASPASVERASGALNPNQSVKVEARGRSLDGATIELNLTTVTEVASGPDERIQRVLESETYYLTRNESLDYLNNSAVGSYSIDFSIAKNAVHPEKQAAHFRCPAPLEIASRL